MTNVSFHRLVQSDLENAANYYRSVSPALAEEFVEQFRKAIAAAAQNPTHFPLVGPLRRVKLKRFPFHALFEIHPGNIRVLLLRHDKRHPDFELSRR